MASRWLRCVPASRRRARQRSRRSWSPALTQGGISLGALAGTHWQPPATHLLAIDPLQVEVLQSVDDEGAPQSQADHGVALRMDGQLLQAPDLSQGRQLHQPLDAALQEDQVLQKEVVLSPIWELDI